MLVIEGGWLPPGAGGSARKSSRKVDLGAVLLGRLQIMTVEVTVEEEGAVKVGGFGQCTYKDEEIVGVGQAGRQEEPPRSHNWLHCLCRPRAPSLALHLVHSFDGNWLKLPSILSSIAMKEKRQVFHSDNEHRIT